MEESRPSCAARLETQGTRYQQNAQRYGVSGANDRMYYGAGELTPSVVLALTPMGAEGAMSMEAGAVNRSLLNGVGRTSASGEFIGPLIGRSGFRTSTELADAIGVRYQAYVDDAYGVAMQAEARGTLRGNANTRIGDFVDRDSAFRLQEWLTSEGITEGPNGMVQMNRWLRDPEATGLFARPDVRIPGASVIYDATVGVKFNTTQLNRFQQFSNGDRVTIVRPQATNGNVVGSYSIVP